MSEAPFIALPRPLRERLGDEGAEALVDALNHLGVQKQEVAVMRSDPQCSFADLRTEMHEPIAAVGTEMHEAIAAVRTEMHEAIGQLRAEIRQVDAALRAEIATGHAALRAEMARSHASLIRWMFVFWIGQLGALVLIIRFAFAR